MPSIEITPPTGCSAFVSGLPGLSAVTVKGVVRLKHKNPTATKRIPFVAVRLRGVTLTKVRPPNDRGIKGPKFKGRWDLHASLPPLILYGGGSAHSSIEPLLLQPNETVDLPFEFRLSKHEAVGEFPASLILPDVNDLRSRGETRHWIECTINWYRKGDFILAERRVAIELWIDNLNPKALSGMLLKRSPSGNSLNSMQTGSIRSLGSDRSVGAGSLGNIMDDRQPSGGPLPTSPIQPLPDYLSRRSSIASNPAPSPRFTSLMATRTSAGSLFRQDSQRRGGPSVTALPAPEIRWTGEGYFVRVGRRVFTGGERVRIGVQVLPVRHHSLHAAGPQSSTRSGMSMTFPSPLAGVEDGESRSSGEEAEEDKEGWKDEGEEEASVSARGWGGKGKLNLFPGFARMVSTLKKKKVPPISQSIESETPMSAAENRLCTIKLYIEETQIVRAPFDSGDVSVVNAAHQVRVDSFVSNSLSPASAALMSPDGRNHHTCTTSVPLDDELRQLNGSDNPGDFVRTATGIKKFMCLLHAEAFEGEFTEEQTIELEVPPIFGAEHLDALTASVSYADAFADTPSGTPAVTHDSTRLPTLRRPGSAMSFASSHAGSPAGSLDLNRHVGSEATTSIASSSAASLRPSIVAATQLRHTELAGTTRATSSFSLRPSRTVVAAHGKDLAKISGQAGGAGNGAANGSAGAFALHASCDHPAITVSHEIVVELNIPELYGVVWSGSSGQEGVNEEESTPVAARKRMSFSNLFSKTYKHSVSEPDLMHLRRLKISPGADLKEVPAKSTPLAPNMGVPEVFVDAEEEFAKDDAVQAPPPSLQTTTNTSPPAMLPERFRSDTPDMLESRFDNIDTYHSLGPRKIVLRNPITVSGLSVTECRKLVLETPSLTGEGLFGVPLGLVEGEVALGILSRRGSAASAAGSSLHSNESRVSWRNLE
ncbi:hypothetical protein BC830DRAFT_44264 [Chytriomyces sp. MP71]|nr:hypothetical protein BC830DRAFT_44264 [Chytriomyces sp. MP71]